MTHPSCILLVEDDEGLAELFQSSLSGAALPLKWVRTGQEALAWLSGHPSSLILLDYSLPDMTATDLVEQATRTGPPPLFIVITGHGDERVAVHMMKLGARDYLVKDTMLLDRLPAVVERVLGELRIRRQLEEAEQILRHHQKELAAIYDHIPISMLLLDGQLRLRKANAAASILLGRPADQVLGLRLGEALRCPRAAHQEQGCGTKAGCDACTFRRYALDTLETGQTYRQIEFKYQQAGSGEETCQFFLLATLRLELDDGPCVLACLEDITQRKLLEDQLRQAQKMEAVGQLAGGVAHDFNNILASIMMHLSWVQMDPQLTAEMRTTLTELTHETNRAANLTRQLLLFSRRQVIQVQRIDLQEVLRDLHKMLHRIIGEQILLVFPEPSGPLWIEADTSMIQQVVLNLCVNARDAMPKGGRLTVSARPVDFSPGFIPAHPEARPGAFVCLSVSDTGCGMDAATQQRIFEPFFTTKEVGQGTGLGLATVFGIIKQHQGWIEVESELGQGSTFRVYLPGAPPAAGQPLPSPSEEIQGGAETILFVEDEASVRKITTLCLRRMGYEVWEAANGVEAVKVWDQHSREIDLLLTDMVMPEGITGLDLAERFRQEKKSLKVIISSGYSTDMIKLGSPGQNRITYLAKPYARDTLAKAIRQCLEQ